MKSLKIHAAPFWNYFNLLFILLSPWQNWLPGVIVLIPPILFAGLAAGALYWSGSVTVAWLLLWAWYSRKDERRHHVWQPNKAMQIKGWLQKQSKFSQAQVWILMGFPNCQRVYDRQENQKDSCHCKQETTSCSCWKCQSDQSADSISL